MWPTMVYCCWTSTMTELRCERGALNSKNVFTPKPLPPASCCAQVLQGLLHCADLSNQTKSFHIASQWSQRIMDESYRQGDEERKLGIPVNPLGDRSISIEKCQVCKISGVNSGIMGVKTHFPHQVTFIEYIVYPLWETWAELVYPDAQDIVYSLMTTKDEWQSRMVHSPSPLPSSDELTEDTATTVADSTPTRRPCHATW